jgi:hypothetical protein
MGEFSGPSEGNASFATAVEEIKKWNLKHAK